MLEIGISPPNPINKMNSHVGRQFYRPGPITIPCNNQDYFQNNEYIIIQISIFLLTIIQTVSVYFSSVYLFFLLIFRPYFLGICKLQNIFYFHC